MLDRRKKILILFASAGHGHEKAARAVLEACRSMEPGYESEVRDALDFTPRFFSRFYEWFYLYLIKKQPWLWGIFYYLADIGWVYFFLRPAQRALNAVFARRLSRLLVRENPSVILSTHFFPAEVAGYLKARGRIESRLVTVITDYLPHRFWVASGTDLYAVAGPECREELRNRGLPDRNIRVTGIPVEGKFALRHSRAELRRRLGLDDRLFTVLLTSGAAAVGSVRPVAEALGGLKRTLQIVVVCGTNEKLFSHLVRAQTQSPGLKPLGFIQNMDEWMEAADLVIGKGGGLTLSESLAKGTPMLCFEPVPGQESRNVRCLEKRGASVTAGSAKEVISQTVSLMESPERLAALRRRVLAEAKPDAAREVVRVACPPAVAGQP